MAKRLRTVVDEFQPVFGQPSFSSGLPVFEPDESQGTGPGLLELLKNLDGLNVHDPSPAPKPAKKVHERLASFFD